MRRLRVRTNGMTLGSCASGSVFLLPPSLSFSACESMLCVSISFTRDFLTKPCYASKAGCCSWPKHQALQFVAVGGCCAGARCNDGIGNGARASATSACHTILFLRAMHLDVSVCTGRYTLYALYTDVYGWVIKVARRHPVFC